MSRQVFFILLLKSIYPLWSRGILIKGNWIDPKLIFQSYFIEPFCKLKPLSNSFSYWCFLIQMISSFKWGILHHFPDYHVYCKWGFRGQYVKKCCKHSSIRSIHNTSMVGRLYRKENCRIIGHVVLGYINFLFVTMNAMLD